MQTEKGYRFTLQFPNLTEQQITVGELLERSGSKKSRLVVEAVAEYIQRHPETMMTPEGIINIEVKSAPPVIPKKEIEDICKAMIEKILSERGDIINAYTSAESVDTALSSMLDNLGDFFN